MPTFRSGRVAEVHDSKPERCILSVDIDGEIHRAIAYPSLIGELSPGDAVIVNTTAVELGLGTGDYHFVLWRQGSGVLTSPATGHIMKLRYTPLQHNVLSVEEQRSPHHEIFIKPRSLHGMPVISGALHSHLEPVVAVLHHLWRSPERPKITYVMTEGAALPIAFSDSVARLKANGLIDTTITVGNAFGGDLEAVSVHSALVAAAHVAKADYTIVAMGPGITGTGSILGFSGLDQGVVSDAAAALGGRSVLVARASQADRRERHAGLSHHTLTVLSLAVHRSTVLPLPHAEAAIEAQMKQQLAAIDVPDAVQTQWVDGSITREALAACDLSPRSMGRGIDEDELFFFAAGAAGKVASDMAHGKKGHHDLSDS